MNSILLPSPPKCGDYRHMPLFLTTTGLLGSRLLKEKNQCMILTDHILFYLYLI